VPLFLAHGDVVVGIAIFHIKLSTPRLGSFICLSLILQGSWSDHCNLILKRKKKGTPPWYVKVGGHLMRHGVDGFLPSSWEPQEEGMMSTVARFSLSKKPRFVSPGKSQTSEGNAC
jgi:hypothetical protein